MTSPIPSNDTLFGFDSAAVAAQIRGAGAVPLPAQADAPSSDVPVSVDGLLPDTLSDRGNAKLFVKLYANDYRHVPG
ncbi:DNA primase, partial [Streptomyces sp. NPDC047525]